MGWKNTKNIRFFSSEENCRSVNHLSGNRENIFHPQIYPNYNKSNNNWSRLFSFNEYNGQTYSGKILVQKQKGLIIDHCLTVLVWSSLNLGLSYGDISSGKLEGHLMKKNIYRF